jgi:hypothetical protein
MKIVRKIWLVVTAPFLAFFISVYYGLAEFLYSWWWLTVEFASEDGHQKLPTREYGNECRSEELEYDDYDPDSEPEVKCSCDRCKKYEETGSVWAPMTQDNYEKALRLVDGCYDIIFDYKTESPSVEFWKDNWLRDAEWLGRTPHSYAFDFVSKNSKRPMTKETYDKAVSLVDGCYDTIFIYKASSNEEDWKKNWLQRGKELGAGLEDDLM